MYKYIIETNFRTLEFDSKYHITNLDVIDFCRMPFVVFEDAKKVVNLQLVRKINIDGKPYQHRMYATQ